MDFESLREEYQDKKHDPALAWDVVRHMQEYAREKEDDILLGRALYYTGELYYHKNDWKQGLSFCNECLMHLQDRCDASEIVSCYNLMGIIYNMMGNTIASVDSYLTAVKHSEISGNTGGLAAIYNNLGNVYLHVEEYPEAIEMLHKATQYSQEFNLLGRRRNCVRIINFCYCYFATKKQKELEKSYQELREFCETYQQVGKKEEIHLLIIATLLHCVKQEKQEVKKGFCHVLEAVQKQTVLECLTDFLMVLPICIEMGYEEETQMFLDGCLQTLLEYNIPSIMERYYRCCVLAAQKRNQLQLAEKMAMKFYEADRIVRKHRKELMVSSIRNRFALHAMEKRYKEAEQHSITDTMTELYNRRAISGVFNQQFERTKREGGIVGLAFMDVDFFKQYNDTHGHVQGDNCLKIIADEMKGICSENVLSMRYGGDEFLLLLTGETQQGIQRKLEGLRRAILDKKLLSPCSPMEQVTVTMGVCVGIPERYDSLYDFILRADRALYKGKENRGSIVYH